MEVLYYGDCNLPDNLVELYNMFLNQLMEKCTPLKTKKVSERLQLLWINATITTEERKRRILEKIWQKNINNNDKYQVFYKQHQTMCNIIDKTEKDFYKKSLHDNKNYFKAIFNICNNLLGRNLDLPLPWGVNNKMLAEEFNAFFTDEIAKIRGNLQQRREECNLIQSKMPINETCNLWSHQLMNTFTPVDHKDVIKCIRKSPSKSWRLDPISTEILTDIVVEIAPLITALINCSLENGLFPDKLKEAFLKPLLKKIYLDPIKRIYRPI